MSQLFPPAASDGRIAGTIAAAENGELSDGSIVLTGPMSVSMSVPSLEIEAELAKRGYKTEVFDVGISRQNTSQWAMMSAHFAELFRGASREHKKFRVAVIHLQTTFFSDPMRWDDIRVDRMRRHLSSCPEIFSSHRPAKLLDRSGWGHDWFHQIVMACVFGRSDDALASTLRLYEELWKLGADAEELAFKEADYYPTGRWPRETHGFLPSELDPERKQWFLEMMAKRSKDLGRRKSEFQTWPQAYMDDAVAGAEYWSQIADRVIVVFWEHPFFVLEPPPEAQAQGWQQLEKRFAEIGVEVIDLASVMELKPEYFRDRRSLDVEVGGRKIAAKLAEILADKLSEDSGQGEP